MENLVLERGKRKIRIYPGPKGSPEVFLNTFEDDGEKIHGLLVEAGEPEHSLIAVSGLSWNDDLSPWPNPAVMAGDEAYGGGADEYLAWMENELFPCADEYLGKPSYRAVAGYSLAGLFALYALYQTDSFDRAASMSGSLWYPEFLAYTRTHAMCTVPSCIYLSVGDRECRTRNPYLRTVQENTEALASDLQSAGIETVFELNKGNHFQKDAERTVKGIQWMLTHGK